ncbi:MAG: Ig-like domain-containing protein [Ignavibacteriaceae bacterium]
MINNQIKIFFSIILFYLLAGCANQLPPDGGEVDTTPPEIIFVYPEDGTTNFSESYFELKFSEYVDKRSFREAIFISPTIDGELEISWTGRTATVEFPSGLRDEFTYVITIGTDVVDVNNRNRMAQSFNFSFSTGSQIDKRSISGRVYDKDAEGILIFAYRVNDDTTDYLKMKPDYISQTGKDGSFVLHGLAEDDYRVFSVKDQLRDLLFQSDQDKIGIPFADVSLKGYDTTFTGLNFFLMSADTIKPRLISSVMTDLRHILVNVSKPLDSTIITSDNFSIIDSTENTEIGILFAFKGNTKAEELVLVTQGDLPLNNELFLRADRLIDTRGNLFTDDYSSLTVSDRTDTSFSKIFKTFPNDLRAVDFKDPVIRFYFDDAFDKEEINNAITFTDTIGSRIQYDINFPDDATIEIIPKSDLSPEKEFLVSLDLKKFKDASGNFNDTTVVYKIRTINTLEFTGASGKVLAESLEYFILNLQSTESAGKVYQSKVNIKSEFGFERVTAGKYLLWGFYDSNQNEKFDYGYPSPLEYSERFFVYKDTLELKQRWTITDILFRLD